MVTHVWAVFFLICLAVAVSVRLRMHCRRANLANSFPASVFPQETKQSRLSNAVQGLVATAGGVYLSLIMIVSFLKINIPQLISIKIPGQFAIRAGEIPADLTVDPLALVSVGVAIIEPVIIKLMEFLKKVDFL